MVRGHDLDRLAVTIPIRMTTEERSLQKLLSSALDVSEYTDKVDTHSRHRQAIIQRQLYELYQIMLGLNINSSKAKGKKMLVGLFKGGVGKEEAFSSPECGQWLCKVFEIGRRYKRMNPDKMRTEYGKLITIMQDAVDCRAEMRVDTNIPVITVRDVLVQNNLEHILADPVIEVAATPLPKMSSDEREMKVKEKEEALREMCERHCGGDAAKKEVVELCIRSLDDGACVLRDNAHILTRMLDHLRHFFHPETGTYTGKQFGDLSITPSRGGSKLSHSHQAHYWYVVESLTLWRCMMANLFHLWSTAEDDMLAPSASHSASYHLRNTGQGMHRMKRAPKTYNAVHEQISNADAEIRKQGSHWVGTKIVHLGDDDVPNALVFIDKYTQVPRIITPLLNVIESIDHVAELPGQRDYIERKFGSTENCKAAILQDFFKYGFDGSGSDGGSCIDGRLTSAWNWCSKLEKKPFYHIFLLCGFRGFDGQW